ncbi:uncharacterized protein LOC128198301 [Bicyclus anynana]|uniref:Uncharacterized protein LOC128198301 n=1 Tax=Bicyclus anynana TaxID=110368 RepID=A0ABM3LI86_BICAN|nr:uncharacterized protein LOC128198301 [Bicyclus anynana]
MPWIRPSDAPVGRVWRRFEGRQINGTPPVIYQIRDLEEPYRKTCLDMMEETFVRDEPLCQALEMGSDPELIAIIRNNWKEYVSQQMSLACFTEVDGEPKELVGFNILQVKCKDDEDEDFSQVANLQFKNEKLLKYMMIRANSKKLVDVFEYYDVDKYLTSNGLNVLSEHRGQNIGARLIEARRDLCKQFGINVACSVFSSKVAQVLAERCQYEIMAAVTCADMLKYGVDLTCCSHVDAKLMGIKFE